MGGIAKALGALAVMAGLGFAAPTLAAETPAPAHAPCTGADLAIDLSAVISACEALITSDKVQGDDLAEALRHLGDAYFRSFEIRTAYEIYQRALELKPDWPEGLWSFGKAASLFDTELAIKTQRRAIELDPAYSKPHTSIAAILSATGDCEGALTEYDRALELDPKDYIARYYRALCYDRLERKLDALHDLDALLADDESTVNRTYFFKTRKPDEDFIGEIYRSRAIIFRDMGSFDEALASLQRALDRRPGYANAAIFRSQLIRSDATYKHLYGDAFAAVDRAMELHPDSPEIPGLSMERARLLIEMERQDEARAIATDSARFESSADGAFFLDRSNVWEELKEFDRAKADLVRGMSADRQSFEAAMQSMQKAGYLMSWQGLDPEIAMANAIVACVHDAWC